jgi:hypothetical protein
MSKNSLNIKTEYAKSLEYEKLNNYKDKGKVKRFANFLYEGLRDIPIAIREDIKDRDPENRSFKRGVWNLTKRYLPTIITWSALVGFNAYYHADPQYNKWATAGKTVVGSIKPFYRVPLPNPSSNDAGVPTDFRDLNPLETDVGNALIGAGITVANIVGDYYRKKRKI